MTPPSIAHTPIDRRRWLGIVAGAAAGSLSLLAQRRIHAEFSPTREEQWVPLFNGKDLEGWTPKITGHRLGENFGETFRVREGVLQVRYDQYQRFDNQFGHLFYKAPFSHYRLRIEYRFVGEQCPGGPGWAVRNSGVMIHGQDPNTMRVDQEFPVSIEAQFLGGTGQGERSTGNLCTPGTHIVRDGKLVTQHCINSSSKTYHGDQWVTAEIEAHGSGTIIHRINGEEVIRYEKPQLDPQDPDAKLWLERNGNVALLSGGSLSLQAESHPIDFRKVEILLLDE
jgi:hypothetical protein